MLVRISRVTVQLLRLSLHLSKLQEQPSRLQVKPLRVLGSVVWGNSNAFKAPRTVPRDLNTAFMAPTSGAKYQDTLSKCSEYSLFGSQQAQAPDLLTLHFG